MYTSYRLLHQLPAIRRARQGYLYTQQGVRYLDLWLEDAQHFMGHQPPNILNIVKNSLSQTLLLAYPNHWQDKLELTLIKKFHANNIEIATQPPSLHFSEPWQHSADGLYKLRPFYALPSNAKIALLGLSLSNYYILLKFHHSQANQSSAHAPLPAYLARFALKMLASWPTKRPDHHNPFASPHFEWQYPYFKTTLNDSEYQQLFEKALAHQILLPPCAHCWGLWQPHLFSAGQIAHIHKILA